MVGPGAAWSDMVPGGHPRHRSPSVSDAMKQGGGSGKGARHAAAGRRTRTASSQAGEEVKARAADLPLPLGAIGRTRHRA